MFIPLSDDNPTLRTPVVTYLILGAIVVAWALLEGFGDPARVAMTVCNLGLVPGELTGLAPEGLALPIGPGLLCVVDRDPINPWTLLTHMFLHGGWGHLLGNALFFWVFGNNVEDSLGRFRFLVFYILCGLAAAGAQVAMGPNSPVPMVGASGAISGVLGAYLLLYPRVRVNVLVGLFLVSLPAWLVLLVWFAVQVVTGLPELMSAHRELSGGVAVWAHIGGFICGAALVKLFEDPAQVRERTAIRHVRHPDHP